jgi:hypothetical protein
MTPWNLPGSKFLNKSVNKPWTSGPGTRNKYQKISGFPGPGV